MMWLMNNKLDRIWEETIETQKDKNKLQSGQPDLSNTRPTALTVCYVCMEGWGNAPHTLDLDMRWRLLINFTFQTLYRLHWLSSGAGFAASDKEQTLPRTEPRLSSPQSVWRSWWFWWRWCHRSDDQRPACDRGCSDSVLHPLCSAFYGQQLTAPKLVIPEQRDWPVRASAQPPHTARRIAKINY